MSEASTIRSTVLAEEHARLGATFTDFGGWRMPVRYSSDLAEHRAVRTAAGLFDLSHMGEVRVEGPQAGAALDHALVGRLSRVAVGRARYSLLCAEDGGILDDLITYRLAEDRFLVVPNAANTATAVAALTERAAGFDAAVTDESAETALLAVQGPAAAAIMTSLVPEEQREAVTALRYYAAAPATVGGSAALVARTGYTGEDGFEVFVPTAAAPALWAALLAAGEGHGLVPAGLAARDSLRLEAGMPLYGHELTRATTPYGAGLGGVVALDKEDFVGRAALEAARAAHEAGEGRRLVGLRGAGRRAARAQQPVVVGEDVVGEVTSGAPSPTLGYPVALAYVDAAHAGVGSAVDVDVRGTRQPFEVVELPFYRRPR
ncbi:glycine cleavage system aminomethyltransferase GcvT [Georgenia thermotolerans]|uniref:Aminomethyltransferase n=1 Tax=Georgenia thermotolerans TaxID=527326 RepID=A0A7J5UNH0_9MICO|nr:glycine cleavage system aminomethyltransferase GcvT [Georgenia thermotolerans]KAE8763820.1 glycine cleavage system aminomethyltransferase GcvT [Georgenia thermotolerans]